MSGSIFSDDLCRGVYYNTKHLVSEKEKGLEREGGGLAGGAEIKLRE